VNKSSEKIRLVFIACVLVVFLISGCAQKDAETKEEDSLASLMGDKSGKSVDVKLPDGATMSLAGDDEGADLPDDYPSDVFPLYKGCFIESVLGGEGSYVVVAYSKDNFKDIVLFYKNLLKEAEDITESDYDDGFNSFGTLGKYTYTVGVIATAEKESYATQITINLMLAQ